MCLYLSFTCITRVDLQIQDDLPNKIAKACQQKLRL